MCGRKKTVLFFLLCLLAFSVCSAGVYAVTEEQVQEQVDSTGKENVTGSLLVWFLCAVAFLKVSQKIDGFMASIGINVGHTGGSMMAEALIVTRGAMMAGNIAGHGFPGKGGSPAGAGAPAGGYFKGGVIGMAQRGITGNAVKKLTSPEGKGNIVYRKSVNRGGSFANTVISRVALGNIQNTGTITGERAVEALNSYMGYVGSSESDAPGFSNVEIGGGRITGTEVSAGCPGGASFGMYSTEKYCAPEGNYTTIRAKDGSTWYKQYAGDTVERTPYMNQDGEISYREALVKRLPSPPKRKDRI